MDRTTGFLLTAFIAGAIAGGSVLVIRHRLEAPPEVSRADLERANYWRRVIEFRDDSRAGYTSVKYGYSTVRPRTGWIVYRCARADSRPIVQVLPCDDEPAWGPIPTASEAKAWADELVAAEAAIRADMARNGWTGPIRPDPSIPD